MSIRLPITGLSAEDAERLFWAVHSGELDDLQVQDVRYIGMIDVLNIKKGHDPLTFENDADAATKINDMLRKGYTILVEVDGETKRVTSYDPTTNEYVIKEMKEVTTRVAYNSAKATAIAPTGGG